MTYVPVDETTRKGHGRTPLEIPEGLLAKMRHSAATGAKLVIDLEPDDDPTEIANLKRAIVRAGYRHFGTMTVHKKFTDTELTWWVAPKIRKGTKK